MDLALAAGIAVALAFIELQSRLKSIQPRAAQVWLLKAARVGLEGVAAIGAAFVARATVPSAEGQAFPAWLVVGVSGGIGGPAFLRLTLLTFGKDAAATPIGLSSFFEPVRNYFERQLDEIGADFQSAWMSQTVLPSLAASGVTPTALGDRLRTYVKSLSRLTPAEQLEILKWIADTVADPQQTAQAKNEALVFKALSLGARRNIERLITPVPPTPVPPAPAPQTPPP